MINKASAFLIVFIFINGCNGGGGSTSTNFSFVDTYSTTKTYASGSGIARSYKNETSQPFDQKAATYYVSNISASDINSTAISNFTNKTLLANGNSGNYYSTVAMINVVQRTVHLFEADNGETGMMIGVNCTGACVVAFGESPRSLPSGTFTYNGDLFATNVGVTDEVVSSYQKAPASLIANFIAGTATLSSTSDDGKMVANSDNLIINSDNGQFSGTGTVISPLSAGGSGNAWVADVFGSFHGTDATSVTGVVASTQQTETGPDNLTAEIQGVFSATRN